MRKSVAAGTLTAPALPASSSEYNKGFRDRRLPHPIDSYHAFDDTCVSYVLPTCSAAWPVCACNHTTAYNVSLISRSLDFLRIGEVHYPNSYSSNRMCPPSCLHTEFIPLPRLPNLRTIVLSNIWVAPADRPFPGVPLPASRHWTDWNSLGIACRLLPLTRFPADTGPCPADSEDGVDQREHHNATGLVRLGAASAELRGHFSGAERD
ncbi:uncharacterized protein LOC129595285 isoform X2 [Paramacrobiotus metropolitanus]|uniref:uncharacterized protein LOC129595285 isoform X2 n=1 Tax=Paramacrobiotus metropolitanus TaxID=2943436 RepID=UPI00244560AE|nr:uncharacterized protein LOC129595285 isoform X2 [Paramacrobiotus metropolitanus]